MARPKKSTLAGRRANRKWRATMLAKYGGKEGFREAMRAIGKKGGENGRGPDYTGGFAGDHELARIAGAIGGRRSSRKGVRNGEGKIHQKEA